MKAKKQKKDSLFVRLIGIFFLISSSFFCGYVIFEEHLNLNPEGQSDSSSIYKTNELDNVNDHLKAVSDKMELERMRTMVANLKTSHGNTNEIIKYKSPSDDEPIINFSDDPRVRELAEDLGRTNELKRTPKDPRSMVYNSVIEDRQTQKYKEAQRRQQAQEFVNKARKDGWIVNLDENFKIKSYRHIDTEDQPESQEVNYQGYLAVPK